MEKSVLFKILLEDFFWKIMNFEGIKNGCLKRSEILLVLKVYAEHVFILYHVFESQISKNLYIHAN